MLDYTPNCECVASWLIYQPFDSVNICNQVSLIIEVTEPETSDFRSVTDVEITRTRISCFFPLINCLLWEILIEEEWLHLLSIISFFLTLRPNSFVYLTVSLVY